MHAQIYLDARIRDYVFIPLVMLMVGVQLLRITAMRYLNAPSNKLLNPAKLSLGSLQGTYFEKDADIQRELPAEPIDVKKCLEEGTTSDNKEGMALARSMRIRKNAEWLPEQAVKTRKAFYCNKPDGYLHKKVEVANPMNMMANPDMMNNMLRQNIQGVVQMMMFSVIGSIFQGFITAQLPFPLGHKFKQMLQQGLNVVALDATYVSSMSW